MTGPRSNIRDDPSSFPPNQRLLMGQQYLQILDYIGSQTSLRLALRSRSNISNSP